MLCMLLGWNCMTNFCSLHTLKTPKTLGESLLVSPHPPAPTPCHPPAPSADGPDMGWGVGGVISIFILRSIWILIFISLLIWIPRIIQRYYLLGMLGIPYWVFPYGYSILPTLWGVASPRLACLLACCARCGCCAFWVCFALPAALLMHPASIRMYPYLSACNHLHPIGNTR